MVLRGGVGPGVGQPRHHKEAEEQDGQPEGHSIVTKSSPQAKKAGMFSRSLRCMRWGSLAI